MLGDPKEHNGRVETVPLPADHPGCPPGRCPGSCVLRVVKFAKLHNGHVQEFRTEGAVCDTAADVRNGHVLKFDSKTASTTTTVIGGGSR